MCETCTHEMTAAVVRGKGAPFALEKATIRAPLGDEVLVRIVATGMCHTDMIVQDQYYPVPLPAVLGHEGAGVVEAVGPEVKSLAKGDHVVLSFGWCGVCPQCKAGTFSYCQKFFEQNFIGISPNGPDTVKDADGATLTSNFFSQSSFATLAIAREGNAVKVPHEAPLEILGPPGCGIQTGAGAVMNSLKVPAGASIAIFGGGAVGLSAVLAAKAVGAATIIVVDIVPSRLALAQDLGATHVLNGKEADPVAEIKALTGAGVDFSLESTCLPPSPGRRSTRSAAAASAASSAPRRSVRPRVSTSTTSSCSASRSAASSRATATPRSSSRSSSTSTCRASSPSTGWSGPIRPPRSTRRRPTARRA